MSAVKKQQAVEDAVHSTLVDHYERYYRLAYRFAGNEQDALDIVQEGAYRAIFKCGQLKNPEYAGTWIYRIIINTAKEFLKKRSRETLLGEQMPDAGKEDAYEAFDVNRALDALDENDRAVIILRYFEELTLEETAEVLGENINTVKSRLYRALRKLRTKLE